MKVKLLALTALLFAGICHAQTVTITAGGTYKNKVYTNTDPSKYAVVIATTQEVTLQNPTITSAGGGITAGINGVGVTNVALIVNNATGTCTNATEGSSFIYLGQAQFLQLNNSTLSGPWSSPVAMSGLTPINLNLPIETYVIGIIGNTFGTGMGSIYLDGMDQGNAYEAAEILNNNWVAPENSHLSLNSLIYVQNNNTTVPSFNLTIHNNTFTNGGFGQQPFTGPIAYMIGTFQTQDIICGEAGDTFFSSIFTSN